jgi:tripartite-type tricarboxylate transporter receptor subunit TctC
LNYASQGNGSVSHIGTEMFKQVTGVDPPCVRLVVASLNNLGGRK